MKTKKPYITPLIQVLNLQGKGVMDSIGGGSGSDNPGEADSKPNEWGAEEESVDKSPWDAPSSDETY